jgi:hypothetical protein
MATKPVKKKAAVKKPVKRAVAKKATAKKASAKKSVAKRTVKKTTAKKPVKKTAAKKPVKRAVAKKTAVKKTAKKTTTKKVAVSRTISYTPANEWLNKEPALPDFLQNKNLEVKKTPVATQQYGRTKKQSPVSMFAALAVLLTVFGASAFFLTSGKDNGSDSSKNSVAATGQSGADVSDSDSGSEESKTNSTPTPKAEPGKSSSSSDSKSASPAATKNSSAQASVQSPRTFLSSQSEQMATLKWLLPKKMDRVVAFEVFAKTSGQSEWVLISTVTTEQLEVEVELTPTDTSSQFRVASLLDNDKKIFNETIITLPGSLT